jgi:ribonuclease VapC
VAEERVLDAFAVMAYLLDEPGAERVEELLGNAEDGRARVSMSTVNLAEVLYRLERSQGAAAAQRFLDALAGLALRFVNADMDLSTAAAKVKAAFPVSLGDAYATALGQRLGASVVTGDPDFKRLEGVVAVEWLKA